MVCFRQCCLGTHPLVAVVSSPSTLLPCFFFSLASPFLSETRDTPFSEFSLILPVPSKQRNVNGQKDQKKSVIIDLMSASIRAKRAEEQCREDWGWGGGRGLGWRLKVSCLHRTGGADVGGEQCRGRLLVKNQQSLSIVTLYERLRGYYVGVCVSGNFHSSAVCLSSSAPVTIKGCQCINRPESAQRLQPFTDSVHYPEPTSCLISHLIKFNSVCKWCTRTGDVTQGPVMENHMSTAYLKRNLMHSALYLPVDFPQQYLV